MRNTIQLNSRQALEIAVLNGGESLKYKETKANGTENKLKGKEQWRLRYNVIVFTVQSAKFVKDLEAGIVASVKLQSYEDKTVDGAGEEITVQRLEFDNYTTTTQQLNAANFERKLKALETTPVTAAEMAAFGFAVTEEVAG